ncbi:unnamed protein product [Arctogadus glacialis]
MGMSVYLWPVPHETNFIHNQANRFEEVALVQSTRPRSSFTCNRTEAQLRDNYSATKYPPSGCSLCPTEPCQRAIQSVSSHPQPLSAGRHALLLKTTKNGKGMATNRTTNRQKRLKGRGGPDPAPPKEAAGPGEGETGGARVQGEDYSTELSVTIAVGASCFPQTSWPSTRCSTRRTSGGG